MTTFETILMVIGAIVCASIAIFCLVLAIYWAVTTYFDMRREIIRIKILAFMGNPRNGGYHDVNEALRERIEEDMYCNEHDEFKGRGYDWDDARNTVHRITERVLTQIVTNVWPERKKKIKTDPNVTVIPPETEETAS